MGKQISWDETGSRWFENGCDRGVLYVQGDTGNYPKGVAWNGLTKVTEAPEGAAANNLYADNIKYASLRSAESFKATIEAYTYPDEFGECDGSVEVAKGIKAGQQTRKAFGFSYRTNIGNDTGTTSDDGYYIHLVYGATAAPSSRNYETVNNSPSAITFSWSVETTPVNVKGIKPTSTLTIDSRKVTKENLKKIEDKLYGTETTDPILPLPDEIVTLVGGTSGTPLHG